ncbi:Mce protein [Mycobacterium intermedium]|uniref:Mce protein n=1 Tax=Mycobacterium intermedium TaxID=28445 RepID=A0A1T3VWT4_MYCIE|nr:Mce protein [Mycobacterium intermedium]ORB05350.1 Mce protein [Mycobacterium intermedium]
MDVEDVEEAEEVDEADEDEGTPTDRPARRRSTPVVWALVASGVIVALLIGLTGWYGYRAYHEHEAKAQRELFLAAARQGAVNLTTIDYTEVDTDVQRILDSSTGTFRDDFERRAAPFVELVKAAQSKSQGTVTEAGLEEQHGDSAQVLVAVAVKSRTAAGEEAPREWRMRIEVKAVGDDAKMSNVVFVP